MQTVLIILGPTASGKSRLALEVARRFNGVLINADSMQIYKNFPILAASPSQKDLSLRPHKLYGLFDLEKNDHCSAAKWSSLAAQEIIQAHQNNHLPIVVGGTGFYIKALMEGLSPIPEVPKEVREHIAKDLEDPQTRQDLYAYLKHHDPHTAHLKDPQRIARSLEILIHTKKPLSFWQSLPKKPPLKANFRIVTLMPPRALLYEAINARTEHMVQNGAMEEVKKFIPPETGGLSSGLGSIGYLEIHHHLKGMLSYEAMLEKIQQRTRHYAKRQMTWCRHQIDPHYTITHLISQR